MQLQWGRVRLNAEIGSRILVKQCRHASMGPRSFERGNNDIERIKSIVRELQWGRVRLNAEIGKLDCRRARRSSFNGAAFV